MPNTSLRKWSFRTSIFMSKLWSPKQSFDIYIEADVDDWDNLRHSNVFITTTLSFQGDNMVTDGVCGVAIAMYSNPKKVQALRNKIAEELTSMVYQGVDTVVMTKTIREQVHHFICEEDVWVRNNMRVIEDKVRDILKEEGSIIPFESPASVGNIMFKSSSGPDSFDSTEVSKAYPPSCLWFKVEN